LYDANKGNEVWFSQRAGFLLLLLVVVAENQRVGKTRR